MELHSRDEGRLLRNANTLLSRVELADKPIGNVEELRDAASSMFVAVFEAVFGLRLGNVERRPRCVARI